MTVGILKVERDVRSARGKFDTQITDHLTKIQGIESVRVRLPEGGLPAFFRGRIRVRRRLRSAATQYERLFVPSQDLLVVDPAKLPATVFTYIHDIFPPTTLFSNTFDALIGRYYIGNAIKCDHIVCASEETQKDVVTRTSFSNTSEVVYQGIDMPDISRDRIVYDLCYVGSLMQRKDPEFLRKSIEQANDAGYRCVAVNFDPVDLPCETKSGLSQSELAELLASCRYYLHPSRLEGFGRSPVEAQSAGTIPIGRDIGINHEILGEEGCEWIAVDRPQDVVDLLDDDPSPSQQDAAQKNAAQYEWSETRARLKELLTENL